MDIIPCPHSWAISYFFLMAMRSSLLCHYSYLDVSFSHSLSLRRTSGFWTEVSDTISQNKCSPSLPGIFTPIKSLINKDFKLASGTAVGISSFRSLLPQTTVKKHQSQMQRLNSRLVSGDRDNTLPSKMLGK